MFEVISNNPYIVVPFVCYLCHMWHKLHKLKSGCFSAGNNVNAQKISIHSIPDTYNSNMQPEFVHSQYFCSYPISNLWLANYLLNEFNTFKISKIPDFCGIINPEISIHRIYLIETSLSMYFL